MKKGGIYFFSFNIAGNDPKAPNEMTLRGKTWERVSCHLDKEEGSR